MWFLRFFNFLRLSQYGYDCIVIFHANKKLSGMVEQWNGGMLGFKFGKELLFIELSLNSD